MIDKILSIFEVIKGLWSAISAAIDAYRKARKENWIADHETVTAAIRDNAKTDDERRELAKKLADLVRSSP